MQESIVSESDDETILRLKSGPSDIDWGELGTSGPHQPNVFVDQQKVVERPEHGHETRRLQSDFVLNLRCHVVLRPFVILEDVSKLIS